MIVDRLRTVSWSNYSHPTGVVKLLKFMSFEFEFIGVLRHMHVICKRFVNETTTH